MRGNTLVVGASRSLVVTSRYLASKMLALPDTPHNLCGRVLDLKFIMRSVSL